jgi:hypothetical protein
MLANIYTLTLAKNLVKKFLMMFMFQQLTVVQKPFSSYPLTIFRQIFFLLLFPRGNIPCEAGK